MSYIIRRDYYKKGDWNAVSDQDGQKRKASNMRMQWDGLWVGVDEFDPKHPQLEIRPRPDNPARYPVRNIEPTIVQITPGMMTTVVIGADGVEYTVSATVLDSSGASYVVSPFVIDSNGVEYPIFNYDYAYIAATNRNVVFLPPPLTEAQMI